MKEEIVQSLATPVEASPDMFVGFVGKPAQIWFILMRAALELCPSLVLGSPVAINAELSPSIPMSTGKKSSSSGGMEYGAKHVCVTYHPVVTIAEGSSVFLEDGPRFHIKSVHMYLQTSLVLKERPNQEGISSGWENMEIY